MSLNCSCCGTRMRALFTSTYCPNECDRPLPAPGHPPGRTPMPGPYGLAMFKESWLWMPNGPRSRVLCCPYCLIEGRQVSLSCGNGRPDATYDATCKGDGTGTHHSITVMDDTPP